MIQRPGSDFQTRPAKQNLTLALFQLVLVHGIVVLLQQEADPLSVRLKITACCSNDGLGAAIRTVLVFTLHLELEGRWPWQQEASAAGLANKNSDSEA